MERLFGYGRIASPTGMALLLVIGLAAAGGPVFGQSSPSHFYDVDKEIRIQGTIRDIRMEPRYENRAPFLIVIFEENATRRVFNIEISPAWFFERDIHKGETLKIVGSPYGPEMTTVNFMAREVQCRGEIINVRDRHGFPNWSGGPRGKRRLGS